MVGVLNGRINTRLGATASVVEESPLLGGVDIYGPRSQPVDAAR
jgi:hypothetical protein